MLKSGLVVAALMVAFALGRTEDAESSSSGHSIRDTLRRAKIIDTLSKGLTNYYAPAQSRDTAFTGAPSYSAPASGYAAPASGYSASSYPAAGAQYPVPTYDNYIYEDEDDEYKKKKKLAIALPIALLAPFAAIGLLTVLYFLISLKALFSLSVLKAICTTNANLVNTNLCQVINSITIVNGGGRDESSPSGKTLDRIFTSENVGQLISFLNSRLNLLDHLEQPLESPASG